MHYFPAHLSRVSPKRVLAGLQRSGQQFQHSTRGHEDDDLNPSEGYSRQDRQDARRTPESLDITVLTTGKIGAD